MEIIRRVKKWQEERGLDKQKYVWANEHMNILEEMMESFGLNIPKDKRQLILQDYVEFILKMEKKYGLDKKAPTVEEEVDAYADIIVFAIGAIMKLGFNPRCVLDECLKEIESRKGKIINGKFQKDTSPEAKAKWYKADYSKCKKGEK